MRQTNHSKQQKLFEVKTRLQNMIDEIDTSSGKANVVRVKIPKIKHLCSDIVPQHFKSN